MTFEEWIRQECFKAPPEYAVELAKSAWDYQQQAIDALSLEWAKQQARNEALVAAATDVVWHISEFTDWKMGTEAVQRDIKALAALLQEPTK